MDNQSIMMLIETINNATNNFNGIFNFCLGYFTTILSFHGLIKYA